MFKKHLYPYRQVILIFFMKIVAVQVSYCQTNITIGTGSVGNSNISFPAPLQDYWEGSRAQYLYRASELTAAGMTPGTISAIKFNVTSLNAFSGSIEEFTMKINGTLTISLGTTTWEATGVPVFGPSNFTPGLGLNTFTLTTPFYWNGIDNILLEICNGAANNSTLVTYTENMSVPYTSGLAFNGSRTYAKDNAGNLCGITANTSGDIFNTATTRPNIIFAWTAGAACNAAGYSNLPFTESFENTWLNLCNTHDAPANSWRNSPISGNNSWRRNDDGASAGWTSSTSGAYSPVSSSGSYSARFHSFYAVGSGQLDLYLNCNTASDLKVLNFDFTNTTGTDSLTVYFSTNGGESFTRLDTAGSSTNWITKTLFFSSLSVNTIVRFVATSDFGNSDIGLDNLSVSNAPNCSGTPPGGTTISSLSSVCASSVPFTVSVTGSTFAAGISFQWQSSADGGGTWTNTAGATASTYSSPGISTSTTFRRQITCGVNSSFSTPVLVTVIGTPNAGTTVSTLTSLCDAGTAFTLSVNGASSGTGLTYQWQYSTNGSLWTNTANGDVPSITVSGIIVSTQYKRQISCGVNSSYSLPVLVSRSCPTCDIPNAPVFLYCNGQEHTVGIQTVIGPSYVWYLNGVVKNASGGNGNAISFNYAINSQSDAGLYTVMEISPGNPPVCVHRSNAILKDLAGLEIYEIGSGYVKFRWTSTGEYMYAVTIDPVPPTSGTITTANNITVNNLLPAVNYYLHVKATCAFGSWTTLTFPNPCPVSSASVQIYCPGDLHTVGVNTVSGSTYTWFKDGVQKQVQGGNGNAISFNFAMSSLDSAGLYTVLASAPETTPVCVYNTLAVIKQPISGLQISQVGADFVTFKWASAGEYQYAITTSSTPPASGTAATGDSITVNNLNPSTNYYLHMSSTCPGSAWTILPFTTKQCYAKPGYLSGGYLYCPNTLVTLTVTQTFADQNYSWLKNGQPVGGAPVSGGSTIVYSFTITSTLQAGSYSVKTTKTGCTDSIFGDVPVTYLNPVISGLSVISKTATEVLFNWNRIPNAPSYQFILSTSATVPGAGYYATQDTLGGYYNLINNTTYYIYVRAYCGSGYGAWSQISFVTAAVSAPNCAAGVILLPDDPVTIGSYGTGVWNLAGTYPTNSIGFSTPGLEKVYRFTPTETAVYYIKVYGSSGSFDYFYKPVSAGCSNTGWTGIGSLYSGTKAIGLLQANIPYYILVDPESVSLSSQKFSVGKAKTGAVSSDNPCSFVGSSGGAVPANSSKIEYFVDDNGNLIGSLDFSGTSNAVGNVYLYDYVNSIADPVRRDGGNKEYLDRNFSISFNSDPVTPVLAKLYFSSAELQRLIDEPNDGIGDVSGINDLMITRTPDICAADIGFGTAMSQTGNGILDLYRFIQLSMPASGSYYFHGGNAVLDPGTRVTCPNSNMSFSANSPGAGYSFQWQLDAGTGFVNLVNGSLYSGVNTTMLSFNSPTGLLYGNKYRMKATNGATEILSPVKTLKFGNIWYGYADNLWENANNWGCNLLPDPLTDVIIPTYLVQYPIINSHVTIRRIDMKPGTKLVIKSPYRLILTGN